MSQFAAAIEQMNAKTEMFAEVEQLTRANIQEIEDIERLQALQASAELFSDQFSQMVLKDAAEGKNAQDDAKEALRLREINLDLRHAIEVRQNTTAAPKF